MIAFLVGQALGLRLMVSAGIGLVEGIAVTAAVVALAERFLFPMPQN